MVSADLGGVLNVDPLRGLHVGAKNGGLCRIPSVVNSFTAALRRRLHTRGLVNCIAPDLAIKTVFARASFKVAPSLVVERHPAIECVDAATRRHGASDRTKHLFYRIDNPACGDASRSYRKNATALFGRAAASCLKRA